MRALPVSESYTLSDKDQKMEMNIGDEEDGLEFEDNIIQDDDEDDEGGMGLAKEYAF